ncbi:unnamed protein product [Hydatigera taeniaeformis]|uniref:Ovule protein n=1 Tax=Hydatigena taeniaeformis TaxID=6205 RepID=A0A0R3WMR6_HYDTA|nr:unnamed protein product [Hydatigera taeniaeformis]
MLPRHCYYTNGFETDKWSGRSHSQTKDLESAPSSLRTSDQMHLLNDANHMEIPFITDKGSSNTTRGNDIFRILLFTLAIALSFQAWS